MHRVKFRLIEPRLKLRRIKMSVPGWAGALEPRADGSHEQPWHCIPFSEVAIYGTEILYPYENEIRVLTRNGHFSFEGEFGLPPNDNRSWPPFRSFGERFYTFQLLLDLKPAEGFATRIDPHPRFFTDATDTVPLAVPALIRCWWPMISFLVFKAPPEGGTHIFRQGEPMAQFSFIPEKPEFSLEPMTDDEAAERELQSRRIHESRSTLGSDSQWFSSSNTVFDATYRCIHEALRGNSLKKASEE